MKPLSTNLLSPVLSHFHSQPENLYNRYNRSTLEEVKAQEKLTTPNKPLINNPPTHKKTTKT